MKVSLIFKNFGILEWHSLAFWLPFSGGDTFQYSGMTSFSHRFGWLWTNAKSIVPIYQDFYKIKYQNQINSRYSDQPGFLHIFTNWFHHGANSRPYLMANRQTWPFFKHSDFLVTFCQILCTSNPGTKLWMLLCCLWFIFPDIWLQNQTLLRLTGTYISWVSKSASHQVNVLAGTILSQSDRRSVLTQYIWQFEICL